MIPAARFYKGEDIRLTIGAFRDESLETPGSFEGYGVDVLLFTSDDESHIALSSQAENDNADGWRPIETNEDGTMEATIAKEWTAELDPGTVRVEIRLTSRATGESFIAGAAAFLLVDSRFSTLEPCMRK